jgi:transcriptional regulator with PAS, ATPase and Fis domain
MHVVRIAEKYSGSMQHSNYGETGTGKELFAHSITQCKHAGEWAFVAVNCAALPEHLMESELFGYAEGAFTGAMRGG